MAKDFLAYDLSQVEYYHLNDFENLTEIKGK
jgi:hypothetical protein